MSPGGVAPRIVVGVLHRGCEGAFVRGELGLRGGAEGGLHLTQPDVCGGLVHAGDRAAPGVGPLGRAAGGVAVAGACRHDQVTGRFQPHGVGVGVEAHADCVVPTWAGCLVEVRLTPGPQATGTAAALGHRGLTEDARGPRHGGDQPLVGHSARLVPGFPVRHALQCERRGGLAQGSGLGLLDDMGQLVGQHEGGLHPDAAVQPDMVAVGEGVGLEPLVVPGRRGVGVDADLGHVVPEALLEEVADPRRHRTAAGRQARLTIDRRGRRRRHRRITVRRRRGGGHRTVADDSVSDGVRLPLELVVLRSRQGLALHVGREDGNGGEVGAPRVSPPRDGRSVGPRVVPARRGGRGTGRRGCLERGRASHGLAVV